MNETMPTNSAERMSRFIYRDNRTPERKIIFEFTASTIMEADAEYKKATGQDVEKQFYIGCEPVAVEKKIE